MTNVLYYFIIEFFIASIVVFHCNADNVDASYDYPDSNMISDSNESHHIYHNTSEECTEMKFYCESCNKLVMCIDTEYGFTKQYVTCPKGSTCLRNECTEKTNPLCDGTSAIPFKCNVPGVFPDPFDCKKFHFCVPKSNKMVNSTLKLKHFEHTCPKDDGVEYRYDPLSRYCKYELSNGCEKWPVPLCQYEAHTDALDEIKSIFFLCENVAGHLYPYLFACPHGEEFNKDSNKCEKEQFEPETRTTTTEQPAYTFGCLGNDCSSSFEWHGPLA